MSGPFPPSNTATIIARRVVPIVLGVPVFLVLLIRILQLAGTPIVIRLPLDIGTILFLFIVMVVFSAPVVWAVASAYEADRRALRESELRYRELFDRNPHPMWVYDRETLAFIAVNDAALQKYGYSQEEFLGMTLKDIRPAEDLRSLEENLAQGSQGFEQAGEWRHLKKDGTTISVEVTSHDVSFLGRPGRLVLAHDITERKRIEAQLRRAQRMESIGTLAGGIAHDLNNVLSPILMATEVLKEKVPDPSAHGLIELMEISALRGANIVRQVLTFARGVEGDRVSIQPRHLISNIAGIIEQTFPKSIRLQSAVSNDLWTIVGDATQIDQVLLNLCVNARDAMPDGGNLTITGGNKVLDEHYARLNIDAKPGPYVVIEVADTGVGIAPANIERIFEPFFTTKEVGKGTGLGLSTARAIVRGHAGFLNVYSEIGKGTSFRLYLPAKESEETKEAKAKAAELPLGRGELILVVDDEAAVRDISRLTLESHNYRVITATDGAQAVGYFADQKEAIDAVLLDMMMPIMDGYATIRALKSVNPNVQIIAASGLMSKTPYVGQTDDMSGAVKAVLAKPFTAQTLLRTLRDVLNPVKV